LETIDDPTTGVKFREVAMTNIKQLTKPGLPSAKACSKAIVEAAKSSCNEDEVIINC
jgi:hypothetical protein